MMERELVPKWTIEEMTLEDVESATKMRLKSWLDTYINDDLGVTREWIEQRNGFQLSEEKIEERRKRFINNKAKGTMNAWVARDSTGKIIGSTTPYIDSDGVQHLGSLYVDKEWHGMGVSGELMQRVIDWFDTSEDIVLGVVTYNERAKAFYKKWGFEEVPDSESLFEGLMPEIVMIRKGGQL